MRRDESRGMKWMKKEEKREKSPRPGFMSSFQQSAGRKL